MIYEDIEMPVGFVRLDEGDPADDGEYLGYFIIETSGKVFEFIADLQYRAGVGYLYDNPDSELIGWKHKHARRKLPIR